MPVFILNNSMQMPSPELAEADGLLAIGGDLSPERLINAYKMGIFPWFNQGEEILWWSPDPRMVLFPNELKISNSMKQLVKKEKFKVSFNKEFEKVLNACATIDRKGQDGTWITAEMIEAYSELHRRGIAKSVEVWRDKELVGGLYGLEIGSIFFGESMFSLENNASKFGFIKWVEHLKTKGIVMIDCQQETPHLKSLGAKTIERSVFLSLMRRYCG
jgi:leucyl/phenylalanyl-tRNA--protein transferase